MESWNKIITRIVIQKHWWIFQLVLVLISESIYLTTSDKKTNTDTHKSFELAWIAWKLNSSEFYKYLLFGLLSIRCSSSPPKCSFPPSSVEQAQFSFNCGMINVFVHRRCYPFVYFSHFRQLVTYKRSSHTHIYTRWRELIKIRFQRADFWNNNPSLRTEFNRLLFGFRLEFTDTFDWIGRWCCVWDTEREKRKNASEKALLELIVSSLSIHSVGSACSAK